MNIMEAKGCQKQFDDLQASFQRFRSKLHETDDLPFAVQRLERDTIFDVTWLGRTFRLQLRPVLQSISDRLHCPQAEIQAFEYDAVKDKYERCNTIGVLKKNYVSFDGHEDAFDHPYHAEHAAENVVLSLIAPTVCDHVK